MSLRDKFEKTETAKIWLSYRVDFDEISQSYYTDGEYKSDVDCLNGAWWMFQELNK